jgi:dTDP-4-amino-4,6-dideoxygalactose transaminase
MELAPGDEIVFTAVNHPDMARIAEAHGLVPIPLDLDPVTLAPRPGTLEAVISNKTRLLVVAHLFGGRVELAPLAAVARRHQILVVEDCAQCLRGPHDRGDGLADVSLFSFGSIKTATALGGALARVTDRQLAERMRTEHDGWPVQSRVVYTRRALKFAGLLVVGQRRLYGLFERLVAATGGELDRVLDRAVRGFEDREPGRQIRQRPSAPLLALLARRLRTFNVKRLEARTDAGNRLAAALPANLAQPGAGSRNASHWVFPVLARDPVGLAAALRQAGFDAARATTKISSILPPSARPELRPTEAEQMMADIVFLPAYPELGKRELARLATVVAETVLDER